MDVAAKKEKKKSTHSKLIGAVTQPMRAGRELYGARLRGVIINEQLGRRLRTEEGRVE